MALESLFHRVRHRTNSPDMSSFSLMDLIVREDWKLVEMECRSNPREVRQWKRREAFFDGEHASTVLPIHQACALCPPKSIVETLAEIYPQGLSACERTFQRTPLHIACQTNASVEVVQTLLELHHDCAHAQDSLGRVSLHYACSHDASPQIVRLLLEAYPAAAQVADNKGWLALHVACRFGDDPEVIRQLVEAFPASLQMPTGMGSCPLALAHKVHDRKHDHIVELLESMMESRKETEGAGDKVKDE